MGASYLTATVTMGLLSFHSPSAEWSSYIENKTKQQQKAPKKQTNQNQDGPKENSWYVQHFIGLKG